jgi:hypothetical protein
MTTHRAEWVVEGYKEDFTKLEACPAHLGLPEIKFFSFIALPESIVRIS